MRSCARVAEQGEEGVVGVLDPPRELAAHDADQVGVDHALELLLAHAAASAASAFRFERKKKNGTRNASAKAVAALAAKYQLGAGCGWIGRRVRGEARLARGEQHRRQRGAQRREQPIARDRTAAARRPPSRRTGRSPPEGSVNRSAPASTQAFALTISRRRPARWAPVGVQREHAHEAGEESQLPGEAGAIAERRFDVRPHQHDDRAAQGVDVAEPDPLPRLDGLGGVRAEAQEPMEQAPGRRQTLSQAASAKAPR